MTNLDRFPSDNVLPNPINRHHIVGVSFTPKENGIHVAFSVGGNSEIVTEAVSEPIVDDQHPNAVDLAEPMVGVESVEIVEPDPASLQAAPATEELEPEPEPEPEMEPEPEPENSIMETDFVAQPTIEGYIPHANPDMEPTAKNGESPKNELADKDAKSASKSTEKAMASPGGHGAKLRDIPNIKFRASKITGKDQRMEALYNIIFGKPGTVNQRKKRILDHTGFAFDDRNAEMEARAEKIVAMTSLDAQLFHSIMEFLDVARTGDNDGDLKALCDFIFKPSKLSDVDAEAAFKEAKKRKPATKKTPAKKKTKKDTDEVDAADAPAAVTLAEGSPTEVAPSN